MTLLAGVALAIGASALYNLGLVVQAEATRREPVAAAGSLLVRVARRSRWWAGTALVGAGWPLQALALTKAPLTVVQPALAAGLVLPLVVGSRRLGERVRRRDAGAVAAVAGGVALVVVAAPPHGAGAAAGARLALVLALLAALAVAALAAPRGDRGMRFVVTAGLAYAWGSLATKLVADALDRRAWPALVAWAVPALLAGVAGTAAEMRALQVRAAGGVASVVFALETIVPVALSPVLFGESWRAGAGASALRAVGLLLALGGAVELSRASPVVGVLDG